tara:strand:- start:23 stop:451 length:429 start_codon:yes stop_codon:yes gene_type:complete
MSALRAEYKFHPISGWISRHPDLKRGVSCMDVDLFFENHIQGFCMHMEFKYLGEPISKAHRSNIQMIADVWSRANIVRYYDHYECNHQYLGYYVIMMESDEVSNDDGLSVARITKHENEVQQWNFDEGAEDVLLRICNGDLL